MIRWHVLTAMGGYAAVEIVNILTSDEASRESIESLAWPVPQVTRLMMTEGKIDGKAA